MIDRETIILDSDLCSKTEIIEELSKRALQLGYVSDINKYIDAVNKREEEFSTAVGYQVSIPHGKSASVEKPFICFLRSKEPFIWDNGQGEAVKMVFLLGVPEDKKETLHLKILAQISRKLMDDSFRNELLSGSKEHVFFLLNQIEENILKDN